MSAGEPFKMFSLASNYSVSSHGGHTIPLLCALFRMVLYYYALFNWLQFKHTAVGMEEGRVQKSAQEGPREEGTEASIAGPKRLLSEASSSHFRSIIKPHVPDLYKNI